MTLFQERTDCHFYQFSSQQKKTNQRRLKPTPNTQNFIPKTHRE